MCYYITATLPKSIIFEEISETLEKFKMGLDLIVNKNLKPQLRPEEIYFRITKSYCDCDTVLGFNNKSKEYQSLLNSKKVKNLRKMRWSEAQIDEWIQDKLKNKEIKRAKKFTPNELELEIKRWFNFLRSINSTNKITRIGIMKHWYDNSLDTEDFVIKEKQSINLNKIDKNFLLNLEEDILYEFYIPSQN